MRAVAVSAFILIQTEAGKVMRVADDVRAIDGVVACEAVTGVYDIVARGEAETLDDLARLVLSRMQTIDGITRTHTCTVVRP
jgi:DNA-binding Lrp family transcriptional regulator